MSNKIIGADHAYEVYLGEFALTVELREPTDWRAVITVWDTQEVLGEASAKTEAEAVGRAMLQACGRKK